MSVAGEAKVAPGRDFWIRRRGIQVRLFALSCLAFLAFPLSVAHTRSSWLYLGLTLFVFGYAWVIVRNTPRLHANRAPVAIVLTVACGFLMVPQLRYDWLSGLAFFSLVMLLINCPLRWWTALVVTHTVAFVAIAVVLLRAGIDSVVILVLLIAITSGVQVAIYNQIDTSMQLLQARAELTQLAVAKERLRIARDLHDILGQRLSAVTLKADLAARMVDTAPQRAVIEMAEVAEVARDALAEVRAAVSGYRKVSLAVEAQSAEALLQASGVVVTVRGALHDLPEPVEECAAWLVREAATNILRHARARRCAIAVTRDDGRFVLEVHDDGVGAGLPESPAPGTGLTGLAERVQLVGGDLSVGPRDGWFVLRAELPQTPASMVHG
ncbi:sensor histidine kinase [Micromonospora sp. NBC_01813]|uniref:sensor histidine kinase n=1 Tax=Micromonospora sp. NBC_01813 TaxID=2975988 RepID=UPI002DD8D91F|nr:sensor histidine kinase [Micromonospora sp. NBC_01813]WSA08954.1 sensor histidine kinase [Micromonospora sp. NBC_01813]